MKQSINLVLYQKQNNMFGQIIGSGLFSSGAFLSRMCRCEVKIMRQAYSWPNLGQVIYQIANFMSVFGFI